MRLKEAAEKAGVPYPTAARWLQQGVVKADGGGTRSTPWECGKKQIRELKILDRLRDAISFQKLRKAAEYLESIGHNPYSSGTFAVVNDDGLVKLTDRGEAVQLLGTDQGQTLCIPIGEDPVGEDE